MAAALAEFVAGDECPRVDLPVHPSERGVRWSMPNDDGCTLFVFLRHLS
jgi:hypothetical protein